MELKDEWFRPAAYYLVKAKGMKQAIIQAFNNLDQEAINRAIDDWTRRLDAVIDAQGGHFE